MVSSVDCWFIPQEKKVNVCAKYTMTGREEELSLHSFLTSALDAKDDQHHAPTAL